MTSCKFFGGHIRSLFVTNSCERPGFMPDLAGSIPPPRNGRGNLRSAGVQKVVRVRSEGVRRRVPGIQGPSRVPCL